MKIVISIIRTEENKFAVQMPYDEEMLKEIRAKMRGRLWKAEEGRWYFDMCHYDDFINIIRKVKYKNVQVEYKIENELVVVD